MINVEGDYEEIVAWMDENPGTGIRFNQHGSYERGDGEWLYFLNVGLFSVMNLEEEEGKGIWMYIHDPEEAKQYISKEYYPLIEDSASVRF